VGYLRPAGRVLNPLAAQPAGRRPRPDLTYSILFVNVGGMSATLALSAIAVLVVLGLGWGVLRRERSDETERFHRASEITSSWAEHGPRYQAADGPAGHHDEHTSPEAGAQGAARSA